MDSMVEKPRRIQLRRTKGWRMPENTVKVTRPGKWGNPFAIGTQICSGHGLSFQQVGVATRSDAVRAFKEMLSMPIRHFPDQSEIAAKLRGRNLACWCPVINSHGEYSPCHADVLLSLANDIPMDEVIRENTRRAKGEAL